MPVNRDVPLYPILNLQKALELKLFEDSRNTINLSTMMTDVIDTDTQSKIDVVKERLIKNHGYIEESARDVIQYVASVFARGDVTNQDESLSWRCSLEPLGCASGL